MGGHPVQLLFTEGPGSRRPWPSLEHAKVGETCLPPVDCEAGGHRADGPCARPQGQQGEEDAQGWGSEGVLHDVGKGRRRSVRGKTDRSPGWRRWPVWGQRELEERPGVRTASWPVSHNLQSVSEEPGPVLGVRYSSACSKTSLPRGDNIPVAGDRQ